MALQIIKVPVPRAPVGLEPLIHGTQGLRSYAVEPPLGVAAYGDEPGLAQNAQVLGDGRLTEGQLADELADRPFGAAQEIQDPPAIGLCEYLEHGHRSSIAMQLYSCQGNMATARVANDLRVGAHTRILNPMVQSQPQPKPPSRTQPQPPPPVDLDRTFSALADPTRRAILEQLSHLRSATVSDLAEPFDITLTGLKKHLGVLEQVELVTTEKIGRSRHCRLGPRRLDDAGHWIAGYQRTVEARFERLDRLLEHERTEQ
jgi:DNA-binding transcriptional ArsR family regulator